MSTIGAEVIIGIIKARTEVDQNPETEVRVGHTRDKVCWNCQQPGHFNNDCRNPKAEGNNSANVVTEDVDDVLLLTNHITVDDWVLDSGASFHTTSHKEIMTNYVDNDFGKVYLAYG